MSRDNGVASSYQYDMAGQLTEIEHAKGRQALASAHYELDVLGRRVAQKRGDGRTSGAARSEVEGEPGWGPFGQTGSQDSVRESYTHDATSQLTGVDYCP